MTNKNLRRLRNEKLSGDVLFCLKVCPVGKRIFFSAGCVFSCLPFGPCSSLLLPSASEENEGRRAKLQSLFLLKKEKKRAFDGLLPKNQIFKGPSTPLCAMSLFSVKAFGKNFVGREFILRFIFPQRKIIFTK